MTQGENFVNTYFHHLRRNHSPSQKKSFTIREEIIHHTPFQMTVTARFADTIYQGLYQEIYQVLYQAIYQGKFWIFQNFDSPIEFSTRAKEQPTTYLAKADSSKAKKKL